MDKTTKQIPYEYIGGDLHAKIKKNCGHMHKFIALYLYTLSYPQIKSSNLPPYKGTYLENSFKFYSILNDVITLC